MSSNFEFRKPQMRWLFLVIITLKVSCSVLAWWLGRPWSIGFWIPLALMAVYIAAGFLRDSDDISDERFGDSCYYLGFIFTISSIATSLLDVPHLDEQGKLTEIAVRFGAAMVTTFVGFIVRAFVAGFKTDGDDAIGAIEARLIASSEDLRIRMQLAAERYQMLDSQVQKASADALTRVQLAIEAAAKASTEGYAAVIERLSADTQTMMKSASGELAAASRAATDSLARAGAAVEELVQRTDSAVIGFSDKLAQRVADARFPQEILDASLREPLAEIKTGLARYAKSIQQLDSSIEEETATVSAAMQDLGRALSPDGKLASALTQHYDALGNLIGLAETTRDNLIRHSTSSIEILNRLAASVELVAQRIESREDPAVNKLIAGIEEFLRAQQKAIGGQQELGNAIREVGSRTKDLLAETKELRTAVQGREPAAATSVFGKIFGR